jgi:hypothetical protein
MPALPLRHDGSRPNRARGSLLPDPTAAQHPPPASWRRADSLQSRVRNLPLDSRLSFSSSCTPHRASRSSQQFATLFQKELQGVRYLTNNAKQCNN